MRNRGRRLAAVVSRLFPHRRSRARDEADMAEEIRLHLEQRTAERLADGLPPDAARQAALRQFGNVAAVKEACRDERSSGWRDRLAHDVGAGVRVLRHRPGFAVAAVVTLALGVGANVAVFSIVRAALLQDLPYRDPDRLVEIWQVIERMPPEDFSSAEMDAIRARVPALSALAGMSVSNDTIRGDGDAESARVAQVTPSFFSVFGVPPLLGRALGPDDVSTNAIVISYNVWQGQYNGDQQALGGTMHVDGKPWTIVGVMPSGFTTAFVGQFGTDAWTLHPPADTKTTFSLFGRLAPGVTVPQAHAEVDQVVRSLQREKPPITLLGFRGGVLAYEGAGLARLGDRDAAGWGAGSTVRPGLLSAQAIAALLLFIACANLANLFLAHTAARRHELGVRAALGAGRRQLVRQLLVEAAMIATLAAIPAVLLAYAIVPLFVSSDPTVLPPGIHVAVSGIDLAVGVGLSWLTVLVFAMVPALLASRVDPLAAVRDTARTTAGRGVRAFRAALVSVQVLLAIVVLAAAGLLINSFVRVMLLPLGFDPRGIVMADVSLEGWTSRSSNDARRFDERVQRSVEDGVGALPVAFGNTLPFGGHVSTKLFVLGSAFSPDASVDAEIRAVSPSYFETLRVHVLRGRAFLPTDDVASPPVALVNETFARKFSPGREILGTPLQTVGGKLVGGSVQLGPGTTLTVVGVVGDVKGTGLTVPPRAAVYTPLAQDPQSSLSIAVRTRSLGRAATDLRAALRRVDPDAVLKVSSLEDRIAASEARRRFYLFMLSIFAALSGALAVGGIYGVTAHATALRLQEFGIRLALGAEPGRLKARAVLQGLRPVTIGLAAGLVTAWWVTRAAAANPTLAAQLYKITPHDAATYAIASIVLLAAGALACWIPTRQVTKIDPALVLKAE